MHPKHLYEGASLSPDKDLMILRSHSRDSQVSNQQSPLIPKSKLATILIVLDYRTNWVRNAYLCDRRTVVAHGPVTGGGFDKKQRHPPDMHNAILFAENDSLWNQSIRALTPILNSIELYIYSHVAIVKPPPCNIIIGRCVGNDSIKRRCRGPLKSVVLTAPLREPQ